MYKGQGALQQYNAIDTQGSVHNADPHRLIQMLMEGALEKLGKAKVFMQQKDYAEKGLHISWAISIIVGLKDSLDVKCDGDIADNLDSLYEYMITVLTNANIDNDVTKIDEVIALIREIKSGWDDIREQAVEFYQNNSKQQQIAE